MKIAIVLAAVLAVSAAQFKTGSFATPQTRRPAPSSPAKVVASSGSDAAATITQYSNDVNPDGGYSYTFQTDNGIFASAQGTPRDFGGNPPIIPVVAQGEYRYVSPEGETIAINYVADENGYQPTGSAIPTAPPVPPQILRALQYLGVQRK